MKREQISRKISRKFLDNGYLINGQSAEERIRYMADTAEKII